MSDVSAPVVEAVDIAEGGSMPMKGQPVHQVAGESRELATEEEDEAEGSEEEDSEVAVRPSVHFRVVVLVHSFKSRSRRGTSLSNVVYFVSSMINPKFSEQELVQNVFSVLKYTRSLVVPHCLIL